MMKVVGRKSILCPEYVGGIVFGFAIFCLGINFNNIKRT